MISQKIRNSFLKYFQSQGHTIVPSSAVIPHDDPTLLFINAGMNQFKDVFLGKSKRDYTRATTTQKCIRVGGKHNDLENVGHTKRHLTFFEMLGNFSFGDYFKKEAIAYAWDVATHIFDFDPDRIWVSVYKDDDEAFSFWEKHISAKKIVRFGEKENFWSMGETGPCGPCSELLYDRGSSYGDAATPYEDLSGERYLEFWNLVFMQYERSANGKLEPLPKKSIDTGSGLERVVLLQMNVDSVFQTDILRSLIAQVETISGKKYKLEDTAIAPAFHVIADHIRSLSFAIADGVQPSNTDRGYVLRKLLRRAVRHGRLLGLQKPFLADLLPNLIQSMGEDFPELKTSSSRIAEILTLEEEAFLRTLLRGGHLLQSVIETSKKDHKISGEDAFKLKDTYGFPLEEVLLIAKDEHLAVDLTRYEQLEEQAKETSRKAQKKESQEFESNFFADFAKIHQKCLFEGFEKTALDAKICAIVVDGRFTDKIEEGQEGCLLLDKTPFYAEMGGQVGDTGHIDKGSNAFLVENTTSPYPGVIAHFGKMTSGDLKKSDIVHACIETERRTEIQNNHTATHLLHWALQKVLGSHIKQAGSYVEAKRLRFDFNHHKSLTHSELKQIEILVNEKIRSDESVKMYEMSFNEVQKQTEIKQIFNEKYGEKVRVIDIGFSKELCGGTHTQRTGMIGYFKIVKESSIAAGVRRIEAVSGSYAEQYVQQEEDFLQSLGNLLKTSTASLLERCTDLMEENQLLKAKLKETRAKEIKTLASQYFDANELTGSIHLISQQTALQPDELPLLATDLLQRLQSGVIVLSACSNNRCNLLIAVTADLASAKRIDATELIKEAAPLIDGSGGGKPHLAQAGGKSPQGLPKAFDKIKHFLKSK